MRGMMKLVAVAACAGLVIGCAGTKKAGLDAAKPRLNTSLQLPDFVLNPQTTKPQQGETFIFGSGECAVYENEADADLAITTADKLARQKILDVVKNKMASGYQYYSSIAGNTNPEVSKAYNNALATSGVMDLPGIEIVKREYRNGVIYSNARWSKSATNILAIIEGAKKSLSNQDATKSISEAQPVWDRLQKDLQNAQ